MNQIKDELTPTSTTSPEDAYRQTNAIREYAQLPSGALRSDVDILVFSPNAQKVIKKLEKKIKKTPFPLADPNEIIITYLGSHGMSLEPKGQQQRSLTPTKPYSQHIPNFEVYIMDPAEFIHELNDLCYYCSREMDPTFENLEFPGDENLDIPQGGIYGTSRIFTIREASVFLQAALLGIPIYGSLPEKVQKHAQNAKAILDAFHRRCAPLMRSQRNERENN